MGTLATLSLAVVADIDDSLLMEPYPLPSEWESRWAPSIHPLKNPSWGSHCCPPPIMLDEKWLDPVA